MRKSGADGNITVTQPFLLHKLTDLTALTVILDMAVDGRNPEATLDWARRNEESILLWVDHHLGGEQLQEVLGERFIYDPKAPSCPKLMLRHGFIIPGNWVMAANAADNPTQYRPTPLSRRYNHAFKASLAMMQSGDSRAVIETQMLFIRELITGIESRLVSERAKAYPEEATDTAIAGLRELVSGVGSVSILGGQGSIDVTEVMIRGYKKFPTIVILTTAADDGQPLALIGTSDRNLDLLQAFGLGSGNPSRIVLTGEKIQTIEEVLG
ncbi:hypothetical protein ACFL08_00290 [Patescibacteria group bacterium]